MDVSDVVHRVALAYWPLIIGVALLGAMAGGALHVNDSPVYTSDVRFVLDAPDPQAAAESTSIADAAKSIATSPSHVSAALALAGVTRDIARYVTQNIELQPLGTSGVLDLQVKDTDRKASAVIANALAKDIIDTRAKVARDRSNALLATLSDEIRSTNDEIAKVDAAIASFRPSSDPSVSAATLSGLYSERASLAQERLTLEAEQNSITERHHRASGSGRPGRPVTCPDRYCSRRPWWARGRADAGVSTGSAAAANQGRAPDRAGARRTGAGRLRSPRRGR